MHFSFQFMERCCTSSKELCGCRVILIQQSPGWVLWRQYVCPQEFRANKHTAPGSFHFSSPFYMQTAFYIVFTMSLRSQHLISVVQMKSGLCEVKLDQCNKHWTSATFLSPSFSTSYLREVIDMFIIVILRQVYVKCWTRDARVHRNTDTRGKLKILWLQRSGRFCVGGGLVLGLAGWDDSKWGSLCCQEMGCPAGQAAGNVNWDNNACDIWYW